MEIDLLLTLILSVAIGAWLLTGILRRYALARSLLDIPNARSSHTVPTPRGGGLAIVVSFAIAAGYAAMVGWLDRQIAFAFLVSGIGVALLGFLDDHGHVPARWRLAGHFLGAIWILWWLGGVDQIVVLGAEIELGWLGNAIAAIYLVWMLNLFNFMDGIDGIAGIEAFTACSGMTVLLWAINYGIQYTLPPLLLAAAVFGFLLWNLPPARIFMGDVGSGFLGLMIGGFSLSIARTAPNMFWAWLILMGVFVVDATVTLLRRLVRRDRFYEAHRSHAYQYASRLIGRHGPVTLGVAAINIGWLFPLALFVALGKLDGFIATIFAYVPIIFLAFRFKAGARELQEF